ncbi:MAG: nuclease, partial [Planctomycetaceae bacterium]|nr:nuclease [Planctomycetaceae bacterium]
MLTAYLVTTANDTVAADGLVSLREAIQAANANAIVGDAPAGTANGDTITFHTSLTGATINLALGEIAVSEDLVINGLSVGVTIDAGNLSRIFNIATSENVTLVGLTLTDGTAADSGGAISVSGGGRTRLERMTISDSVAAGAGGGAVFSHSSVVVVVNSVLSGNSATGASGAGGAILNGPSSQLTVFNSTISGNTANRAGGGIEDISGAGLGVLLTGTNLVNNNAGVAPAAGNPGDGGGLHVTGAGDVSITGGQITGNTAARQGGGLWTGTGKMTIVGTLIDANIARGNAATDGGGGIYKAGGVLNIGGQTVISNNRANGTSGSGGGLFSAGGGVTINSSTFRRNIANRAGGAIEIIVGTLNFTLSGLFQNTAGPSGTAAPGNGGGLHVTGANALSIIRLSEVRENVAAREGGGLWNADGGTMRVLGSLVTVNVASGAAADDGGGGIFNDGGNLTIVNSAVTENRATGTAGSGGGVFSVDGTVLVNRSTIARNVANRAGGGIEIVTGYVDVDHSFLNGNIAGLGAAGNPGNGGAVHVTGADATVFIRRSDVLNNRARLEGGGLWNAAGSDMFVFVAVVAGNVANGAAAHDGGGGIFNNGGDLTVTRSTVIDNRALPALGTATSGGGIFTTGGLVSINSSEISRNVAGTAGGGVKITGGTVNINSSVISDNIAGQPAAGTTLAGQGGGVSISGANSTVTLRSSVV